MIFFHTIAMNFILALSIISEEFDILLIITDKFSKRVLLMLNKENFDAFVRANIVLISLISHDWDISWTIISDRDSMFISSFWRKLFQLLNTKLLISTAYHSQTNESFERTNQTVKFAFRYYFTFNSADDITVILFYMQTTLNNSVNVIIELSSNKIIYEFRTNDVLVMLFDLSFENWNRLRQVKREEVEKAIVWTNVITKSNYDVKHTIIDLKKNSMLYFRFHRDYIVSELRNRKLTNQRMKSFKILEKIENLTYRLNLSLIMRIHSVIFVAQLKSFSLNDNFYQRSRDDESLLVKIEDDFEAKYEIEKILNKIYNRQKKKVKYLVKWMKYHDKWNIWHSKNQLSNVIETIQNYENNETKKSKWVIRLRRRHRWNYR